MQAIQAQSLAMLPISYGKPSKILTALAAFFSAVEEGFNKAEQYEALARKSNSELAALGLTREDLPRLAMFGKTKDRLSFAGRRIPKCYVK